MAMNLIRDMRSEITLLRLLPRLPVATALMFEKNNVDMSHNSGSNELMDFHLTVITPRKKITLSTVYCLNIKVYDTQNKLFSESQTPVYLGEICLIIISALQI